MIKCKGCSMMRDGEPNDGQNPLCPTCRPAWEPGSYRGTLFGESTVEPLRVVATVFYGGRVYEVMAPEDSGCVAGIEGFAEKLASGAAHVLNPMFRVREVAVRAVDTSEKCQAIMRAQKNREEAVRATGKPYSAYADSIGGGVPDPTAEEQAAFYDADADPLRTAMTRELSERLDAAMDGPLSRENIEAVRQSLIQERRANGIPTPDDFGGIRYPRDKSKDVPCGAVPAFVTITGAFDGMLDLSDSPTPVTVRSEGE